MESNSAVNGFAKRVGYSPDEIKTFKEGGHRVRHVERLSAASQSCSIQVEIVGSENCNSRHTIGQRLVLDADGNFISALCPKRVCVYLVSQLNLPVALINERLSEGLDPQDFHFARQISCQDVGVECMGYGKVVAKVEVVRRSPATLLRQSRGASSKNG